MILTPIGKRAPTAGTPILLIPSAQAADFKHCHSLLLKAHGDNTGAVYILSDDQPADTTNYSNIVWELGPGEGLTDGSQAIGDIDPTGLYVDVETTNNFLFGFGKRV